MMNAAKTMTSKFLIAAAVTSALTAAAHADDRLYTGGANTNGTAYLTSTNWAGLIYAGTYGNTAAAGNGLPNDVAVYNSPLTITGSYVNFSTVNNFVGGLGYFSSGGFNVTAGLTGLGSAGTSTTLSVGGLQSPVLGNLAGTWQLNGATITTSAAGVPTPVALNNAIAVIADGATKNLSLVNQAVTSTATDGTTDNTLRTATTTYRLGNTTNNTYVTAGRTLSITGLITEAAAGSGITKYGAGTMVIGTSTSSPTNTFTGGLNVLAGTLSFYSRNNLGAGPIVADGGNLTVTQSSALLATTAAQTFTVGPNGSTFTFNSTAATSLTITSGINGSGRLTVTGNGTGGAAQVLTSGAGLATRTGGLTVTGGATFSSTFTNAFGVNPAALVPDQIRLDNGTIRYTDTGSVINFGSNKGITLGAGGGGILVNSNTETLVVAAPIASDPATNGTLTVGLGSTVTAGPGTLRLTGTNTYTGPTVVNAGILRVNGSNTGGGAYTVNAGATLGGSGSITLNSGNIVSVQGTLSPGALIGSAAAPSIANFSITGDVSLNNGTAAGTLLIDTSNVATQNADNLVVSGALTLTGATLNVTGQPAIDGSATIIANYGSRAGTFATTNLPAGYTLAYDFGTNGNQLALLRTGVNTLFFTGSQDNVLTTTNAGTSNFTTDAGGTTSNGATPSGATDIVFNANANTTAANFNTVLGANVTVNSLTFNSTTPVSIGGTNTLTIVGGTGSAGLGNGIVNSANAVGTTITAPIAIASSQSFTNNNVASPLTVGGTVALAANTLTLAGPGATNVSGVVSGTGGITKAGAGRAVLTGANTYTGTTTVQAGVLELNSAAANIVLTGGPSTPPALPLGQGADIQGGRLVFNYADTGTSPLATVKTLLTAGYAQPTKFATGLLRGTTLAGGTTLGYGETGNSTLTIRVTLPGDANLDGAVGFDDFVLLQGNFNQPNVTFAQGDFDYNDVVNFNDFVLLQGSFGQSLPGGRAAAFTREQFAAVMSITDASQVPEPAMLSLVGLGAAGLLRRRRTA